MNGRQYNIDIDTYYGRVKCEEYERKQAFNIPKCSDSFKKNGDTYMVVGAPNKIDAMLAAIQQLHIEMHNLQDNGITIISPKGHGESFTQGYMRRVGDNV